MFSIKGSIIFLSLLLLTFLASCNSGDVSLETKGTNSYTGAAILSWATPTTYTDGSQLPATNIQGYGIYIRLSGSYNVGTSYFYFISSPTTSVAIKDLNLPVGQYYFAVTALDISGSQSNFSQEVLADLK